MPTEDRPPDETLCMLCQVNPVEPGKKVCTGCWQLAPAWVKRTFMRGEKVDWSQLLEADSNPPIHVREEKKHGT